jgi:multiple sugar transport system permease protein
MAAPSVVFLAVFLILPVIGVVLLTFTNWRYPGSQRLPTRFVGIENLTYVLKDTDFRSAIGHNLIFTALIVPLQTALALALALLINKPVPGRAFFRAVFFIPIAVPIAVSGLIWKLVFNDGAGREGLASTVVRTLSAGLLHPNWWGSPQWAWLAVVVVSLWASVGFQMVILLAALQDVPPELHEAAMLDGAGVVRRFVSVTVPAIRNQLFFVISVTVLFSFRLFDTIYVLPPGAGEPRGSTSTVMLYIVQLAQRVPNAPIGRASAATVVFLLIVLAVNVIQRRFEPED